MDLTTINSAAVLATGEDGDTVNASGSGLAETQRLVRAMVGDARELEVAANGCVTDGIAGWLAGHYAATAHENLAEADGRRRWEVLRAFVQDWAVLRRGDHEAARLQLERKELEWQRANSQSEKEKEFRAWLKRPEIRKEVFPELAGGISPATLRMIEKELRLL